MTRIQTLLQTALVLSVMVLLTQLAPTPTHVTAQAQNAPNLACIGNEVGQYIDTFFNDPRTDSFQHIKFITPVFNMTSPYLNDMVNQIASNVSSTNWAKFDFVGGNAYNFNNGPYIRDWVAAARANQYIGNRPVILTEIGWYEILQGVPVATALTNLTNEINWIKSASSNVEGALLFNVFNNNPGWSQYALSDEQITTACSGNCGNVGANSAGYYSSSDSDFYGRASGHGMGFTLEIANNDNNPSLPSLMPGIQSAHSRGITPIVRIGVMNDSGGFDDPQDYVTFLQALDSMVSQDVYVIVGPNEPETECWGARPCFDATCATNPGAPLSCATIPWEPIDATIPTRDVTCACTAVGTTTCNPFANQLTFNRPTGQDSGQADGTGTGSYSFYDNDTRTSVNVPPIIGTTSSDGGTTPPPGGGPPPPPPVGNCLACPILAINNNNGYAYCDPTFYDQDHRGKDYIANPGAAIYAVTNGTITHSGWGGGYGYRVLLAGNDGNTYVYGHLHPDTMPAAGPVTVNQQIGTIGPLCLPAGDPNNGPGCATNGSCCTNGTTSVPHLHFEAQPPGVGYGTTCRQQLNPEDLTPSDCFGHCTGGGTGSCGQIPNCNPNATFDPTLNNVKPVEDLIAAIPATWSAAPDNIRHCYNDVISRSISGGLDPAFAMAIWIEESGASNYCLGTTVGDFGMPAVANNNFSTQLNVLLNLPHEYATYGNRFADCRNGYCPPGISHLTVLKFLQTFSGGPDACINNHFGGNPHFFDNIRRFYRIAHKDGLDLGLSCVLPNSNWSTSCTLTSACTLYP